MIAIDLPPVGVKILQRGREYFEGARTFEGVSFCHAVFRATFGEELIVRPGSIRVCQWAPVVLGFKAAENAFERTIEPHLVAGTHALYVAPLHLFRKEIAPDVVVVRTDPEAFRRMTRFLGWEKFIDPAPFRQDVTALHSFREDAPRRSSARAIRTTNALLAKFNHYRAWHAFTTIIFRSTTITRLYDRLITAYMANMSVCRNSVVIPLESGRANVSHFCTGGISWGKNRPDQMTAGFPWRIYEMLHAELDFPGKNEDDGHAEELAATKKELESRDDGGGCMSQKKEE